MGLHGGAAGLECIYSVLGAAQIPLPGSLAGLGVPLPEYPLLGPLRPLQWGQGTPWALLTPCLQGRTPDPVITALLTHTQSTWAKAGKAHLADSWAYCFQHLRKPSYLFVSQALLFSDLLWPAGSPGCTGLCNVLMMPGSAQWPLCCLGPELMLCKRLCLGGGGVCGHRALGGGEGVGKMLPCIS